MARTETDDVVHAGDEGAERGEAGRPECRLVAQATAPDAATAPEPPIQSGPQIEATMVKTMLLAA